MLQKTFRAMTLVELLVAIAIMLIGMQGFSYLLMRSMDTNKFILEEGIASATASHAANKTVRELRKVRQSDNGSFAIVSGSDFDLKVYMDIDGDGATERVHYFLDQPNDLFKVGITNPQGTTPVSYPATDDTVITLANYITNTASDPIFYYYNQNYPGDTVNNPMMTPVAPGNVRLVRVHFMVNIDPIHAPNNVNVESFADLRNLETYE